MHVVRWLMSVSVALAACAVTLAPYMVSAASRTLTLTPGDQLTVDCSTTPTMRTFVSFGQRLTGNAAWRALCGLPNSSKCKNAVESRSRVTQFSVGPVSEPHATMSRIPIHRH